jgi:membrane-bound lytic murein transglycosylase D
VKVTTTLVCVSGATSLKRYFVLLAAMSVLVAGCASINKDVAHFDPVPREEVCVAEIEPVVPEGGDRLRLSSSNSDKFSNLDIPYPLPAEVEVELDELQNSYPQTFQRGLNRSTRYMPYLKEEFRKAGLPEDLAWLAMVESMFQPKVVSPAGAGGMWQFMRATGRRYNLRMDSYVDERYNWHSATSAAIEYLKGLHNYFDGEWALAVTAYNMGEGGLGRAISANDGERDFFTLVKTPPACDRMKEESKKYYPRLIAYIIAANDPEAYGFTVEPESFEDVLRVPVEGMYHLSDLERVLGLSHGTLARLNPDLLREATPPQGKYPVAVPREKHEQFLAALKTVKSVRYAGTHRVKRGETISQIARKYGVSDKELMRINNIRSARSLQVNQNLQLPVSGMGQGGAIEESPTSAPETQADIQTAVEESTPSKTYKVKRGDTLYDVARAHKVNIADLQRWNNLGSRSQIKVGQTLSIGAASVATASEPMQYHTVKPGEYPGIIAQLYGVSVNDLLQWNGLSSKSVIKAGDKLTIAGKRTADTSVADNKQPSENKKAPAPPAIITHKVAKGETPGEIASRYGVKTHDLLSWNKLTAKSIIRVGQELSVHTPTKGAEQRDRDNDVTVAQVASSSPVMHKVTAGQNPTVIAKRYGVSVNDLFKWNNWNAKHVLQVGMIDLPRLILYSVT